MPFTLLAIPLTASTPNILSTTDNGAFIATIPAGSYVDITLLSALSPDQPGSFLFVLGPDVNNQSAYGPQFGQYSGTAAPSDGLAQFRYDDDAGVISPAAPTPTMHAITPQNLYLTYYPDALPPSAFTATAVLKIYS